jgi:hypothetical protein
VKHPKPVIGNDIVQDFNQVRLSVKTDKQVFVFGIGLVFVKKTVVFDGIKCQPYVYLAYAVFESSGIELYGNIHAPILLQKKWSRNILSKAAGKELKGAPRGGLPPGYPRFRKQNPLLFPKHPALTG